MYKFEVTFIFFFCVLTLLSQNNSSKNEGVYLSLPKEIVITEGDKLEIFKHSIINAINPDNYFLSIKVVDGSPKGNFYDRKFVYDCMSGDEKMSLEFILKNDNLNIIDQKTVTIIPVKKADGPTINQNILIIGDSFTAHPIYPNELARRLTGTNGFPIADGLKNITFIGTTPKDANIPREGHNGKSWSYFLEKDSPFWNKKTNQVDFENYCTSNGYSKIDVVIILLGTNDMTTDEVVSNFLDKIIAYNPSIKGIVTGKILPTPFGGTGSSGMEANQNFYSSVKLSFNYNRRMENLISSHYAANFRFVDILASFDIDYNMLYKDLPANTRNPTLVKQGVNNVHPDSPGYLQIADIIYSAFHYFILN